MNAWKQIWVTRVVRAEFFSPMWFVGRALLITVFYFACHAAGLRERTTFLSGTAAGVGTSLNSSAVMGMTYLVAYFGFVLMAPIFLVAALLMAGFQRKKERSSVGLQAERSSQNNSPPGPPSKT